MNDSSGVEYLGQAFGLEPQTLTRAVKLFGVAHPSESIEEIATFLEKASNERKNVAKAFSALIAGYKGKITRERDEDDKEQTDKFFAPMMLEKKLNIPRYVFKGLMCSINKEEKGVKEAILALCKNNHGKFLMDDAFCRGFLSISTGGIDGIEDICHIINFNADYAEVLVMLANQNELSHQQILQNTQFATICVKLVLKTPQMAAMLALT